MEVLNERRLKNPEERSGLPRNVLARRVRSMLAQYHKGGHDGNGSSQRVAIYDLLRQYDPKKYAAVEGLIRVGGVRDLLMGEELIDLVTKRVLNPVRIRRGPNGSINQ